MLCRKSFQCLLFSFAFPNALLRILWCTWTIRWLLNLDINLESSGSEKKMALCSTWPRCLLVCKWAKLCVQLRPHKHRFKMTFSKVKEHVHTGNGIKICTPWQCIPLIFVFHIWMCSLKTFITHMLYHRNHF